MPRQRITKEFLLEQAYCLVKEQGMDAVSAKALARLAKCSVQPIYSYYANMDELPSSCAVVRARYCASG